MTQRNQQRRLLVFVVAALATGCANGSEPHAQHVGVHEDRFAKARAEDIPSIASGWSAPVRLEVSGEFWGDSLWVKQDASVIYFMHYPGDAMTDVMVKNEPKHDPDVYMSVAPFEVAQPVSDFQLDHPVWGCAGPMIDENGDFWFMSNRQWETDKNVDTDIYRNGEYLAFNTDDWYTNPHYCVATDELWFDHHDQEIMVLRNASAGEFAGQAELAPMPLNSSIESAKDSHPWLNTDGSVMYFSSTRNRLGHGPSIMTSRRASDGTWSEPELVVWDAEYGVGEPSLTADGSKLFYEQVYYNEWKEFTTEFYYLQRTGAAVAGLAPTSASEPADASQDLFPVGALLGLGATKRTTVDPTGNSLTWEYTFGNNPFPMLLAQSVDVRAEHLGVVVRLRSQVATRLSVVLSEVDGARYDELIDLPAGETIELVIPFSDFGLQESSYDSNARLDRDRIDSLALIDAKAILGQATGANNLIVERFGFAR